MLVDNHLSLVIKGLGRSKVGANNYDNGIFPRVVLSGDTNEASQVAITRRHHRRGSAIVRIYSGPDKSDDISMQIDCKQ